MLSISDGGIMFFLDGAGRPKALSCRGFPRLRMSAMGVD